ncbi:hypothetical protein V8C86DRAFT_1390599 [Haematococcus lacustris]
MAQDAVYHFYGTAIEDELDNGSARHKPVQDLAVVRNAPVWAQEPTDEQGRKRFHGAFTGGFSAGYFNTVGSKEGWQPTTFRSSRGARAAAPTQAVEDYLDEDEKEERVKVTLQVQPEYDTFGASAAEAARSFAQQEAAARPSLIPGGVMEELVVPVTSSVGVRLLQKMGWRPGRGVGAAAPSQNTASLPSAAESGPGSAGHVPATAAQRGIAAVAGRGSRWGSVAGVSLDNTPIYVLEPKQDQHGLGYDPFAGAEDFRAAKRQRQETSQQALKAAAAAASSKQGLGGGAGAGGTGRLRGVAFAGVKEDTGMYGYMEDYVEEEGPAPSRQALMTGRLGAFNYELGDSDEDEDAGFGRRRPLLLEPGAAPSAPLMLQSAEQLRRGGDYIPGFTKSQQQVVTAVYPAAQVPADWREQHVLPPRLGRGQLSAVDAQDAAPVREAAPPADPNLHREIDSLAAFVARSGPAVEALARKQARLATVAPRGRAEDANIHDESHEVADSSDAPTTTTTTRAKFAFLLGGEGCEYYAWRLHKIRAALSAVTQRCGSATGQSGSRPAVHGGAGAERDAGPSRKSGPLSVEQRMALLGEAPLPSSTAAAQALAEATDLAHGRRTEGGGGAGRPGAGPGQGTAETAVVKAVAEGDRARLQEAMSSMFVKGESQDMTMEGGAQVGLRPAAALSASTTHPGGGMLSGAAAAAMAAFGSRFTSGTSEATRQVAPDQGGLMAAGGLQSRQALQQAEQAAMRPRRSAEDWRPEPLVCKRFNVPDPYKGQPQEAPGARPRIEQLALMHTAPGAGEQLESSQQAGPASEQGPGQGRGEGQGEGLSQPGVGVQHGVPAAASGVHLHAARAQAAAIASRLVAGVSALPPPPPLPLPTQQQLPPPPPLPLGSQGALDAKAMAADFLSSLSADLFGAGPPGHPASTLASIRPAEQAAQGHVQECFAEPTAPVLQHPLPGPGPGAVAGVGAENRAGTGSATGLPANASGGGETAKADLLLVSDLDRPLDIFKAIFEDEVSEEGEEAGVGAPQGPSMVGFVGEVLGSVPSTAQAPEASALAVTQGQGLRDTAAPLPAPRLGTQQQLGLAAALLRAQEVAADKAKAAAARQQAQPGAGAADATTELRAEAKARDGDQCTLDIEVQQRIKAALNMLRTSQPSGKVKKEKRGKKKRKGSKADDEAKKKKKSGNKRRKRSNGSEAAKTKKGKKDSKTRRKGSSKKESDRKSPSSELGALPTGASLRKSPEPQPTSSVSAPGSSDTDSSASSSSSSAGRE